jgi:hypothetical protein
MWTVPGYASSSSLVGLLRQLTLCMQPGCIAEQFCTPAETSRTYTSSLALLDAYPPKQLIIVASSAQTLGTGINQATRAFSQTPLPRVCPLSSLHFCQCQHVAEGGEQQVSNLMPHQALHAAQCAL